MKLKSFYKLSKKNIYVKYINYYYRPINYDIDHNCYYKDFLVKKSKDLSRIELLPKNEEYTKTLIWLYAGDWPEFMVDKLTEYGNFPPKDCKLVLISAPVDPITWQTAVIERSWFNIFDYPDFGGQRYIDRKSNDKATSSINREIKDQYNLIGNYSNIYIGGFSQGACMSLHSALSYEHELGGVIALNGFKFDFTPIDSKKSNLKIVAVNGLSDEVVLIKEVRQSFFTLKKTFNNFKLIEEVDLYHNFTKNGIDKANMLLDIKDENGKLSDNSLFVDNKSSTLNNYKSI